MACEVILFLFMNQIVLQSSKIFSHGMCENVYLLSFTIRTCSVILCEVLELSWSCDKTLERKNKRELGYCGTDSHSFWLGRGVSRGFMSGGLCLGGLCPDTRLGSHNSFTAHILEE